MRPWLLEVNSSPQLDAPTKLDADIKQCVIKDVIGVLQPAAFCREQLANVLKRRLANAGRRASASQGCTKGITMAEERSVLNEDVFKILVRRARDSRSPYMCVLVVDSNECFLQRKS